MSLARLRQRVPSACSLGCHILTGYDLRFHKAGRDGSAKCDAFFTSNANDVIYGVLFEIDPVEKTRLDKAEGLGNGYDEKRVQVTNTLNNVTDTFTYVATHINTSLHPFSWYLNHVLVGAHEASLPDHYVSEKFISIVSTEDPNRQRDRSEREIHH